MIHARTLATAAAACLVAGCGGGGGDAPAKRPRTIHLAMEVGAAKVIHAGDVATPGGTASRRVKWVTIDSDEYPYDGFKHAASVRVDKFSGGFDFKDRPRRNTRYRATAEGTTSRTVTVYVLPRTDLAVHAAGSGSARLTLTEAVPPRARLIGDRRVFFYVRRAPGARYRRIARARLALSARGRASASATAAAKGGQFFACSTGAVQGMGSPRTRLPDCGALTLPYPLPPAQLG